jgi:hypothetical protein
MEHFRRAQQIAPGCVWAKKALTGMGAIDS